MKTKKLTESAMLAALFIVISIVTLGTGIAYSIYLDIAVPIIISLIYLKCDFKYTILSTITSISIIIMVIGDVYSALFMIQGVLIGIVVAKTLKNKGTIFDDIIICGVLASIVMVFIDVYFSTLIGVSFIKEFREYASNIQINNMTKDILVNISVVLLPMGTVFVTYIGTLFLGNKLNLLNTNAKAKYKIVSNFKKYGGFICCSEKTIFIAIMYIILFIFLEKIGLSVKFEYINIIIQIIGYIFIYFIVEDSYSFISKYIYKISKSKSLLMVIQFIMVVSLFINFEVTLYALIILNFLINKKFNFRQDKITLQINQRYVLK